MTFFAQVHQEVCQRPGLGFVQWELTRRAILRILEHATQPPAALQITWQSVIEQIGWKIRAADQVQLR